MNGKNFVCELQNLKNTKVRILMKLIVMTHLVIEKVTINDQGSSYLSIRDIRNAKANH